MHKLYVAIAITFSLTSARRQGQLLRVRALFRSLQNGHCHCRQKDALLWSVLVFLTCLPWALSRVQPMWWAAHALAARTRSDLPAVSTRGCRRYWSSREKVLVCETTGVICVFVLEVKKSSLVLQVLSFEYLVISRGETLQGKSCPRTSKQGYWWSLAAHRWPWLQAGGILGSVLLCCLLIRMAV